MKFALGYCWDVRDLFAKFLNKWLKLKSSEYKKIKHDTHREDLVIKIFIESVKLVINDVIDNNVTFILPVQDNRADIHMRKIEGDDFKTALSNGKFKGLDFLKSYFTAYMPALFLYHNGNIRTKDIHVSKALQQKIIDNMNNGKQYC